MYETYVRRFRWTAATYLKYLQGPIDVRFYSGSSSGLTKRLKSNHRTQYPPLLRSSELSFFFHCSRIWPRDDKKSNQRATEMDNKQNHGSPIPDLKEIYSDSEHNHSLFLGYIPAGSENVCIPMRYILPIKLKFSQLKNLRYRNRHKK